MADNTNWDSLHQLSGAWISQPEWHIYNGGSSYEAYVTVYWPYDPLLQLSRVYYYGGSSDGWVRDADCQNLGTGDTYIDGTHYKYYRTNLSGYRAGTNVTIRTVMYYPATSGDFAYIESYLGTTPSGTVERTITFNSNGATSGSLEKSSTTVLNNTSFNLPGYGTCEKPNYVPDGWADSASGNKVYDFGQSFTVTANKTFYLHWLLNVYNMTVSDDGHGTGSVSSPTVTAGNSVTFTATPNTNYAFDGWYNGSLKVSSLNPYTVTPDGDLSLQAKFVYTGNSASYLYERITNKVYTLTDGESVHGTGTSGRIARWKTNSKTVANAYLMTYGTPPSSVTNGDIYILNNVNYPSDTNWVRGSGQNWGETVYCCIKINLVSETATSVTLKIQTNSYVTGFDGGIDASYASWYVKQDSTYLLNQSGVGYTWDASWGGSGYLASGNFYDSNVTINKSSSAQTITFEAGIGATGYTTATVSKSVTIPASGYRVCVGQGSSWKAAQAKVLYNGSWTDATMYIFNGTEWIKGNYTP